MIPQQMYKVVIAARQLLAAIDAEPWRVTSRTFGKFAFDTKRAADALRTVLDAEQESSQRQPDESPQEARG